MAHEIVLPVSPRAALLWGPLQSGPYTGDVVRERLDRPESQRFADLANAAMCEQALDLCRLERDRHDVHIRASSGPWGPLMPGL